MLDKLTWLGRSSWYWLSLVLLGLVFESVALFYQYVLDYWPCVLCIHVRIWVLGLILVAVTGFLVRHTWSLRLVSHLLVTTVAAGLLERSWQLLGTERGFIVGSCAMESGLPAWFALDDWFPAVFKVWEACGYTPELLFGVTMAEALLTVSGVLFLIGLTMSLVTVARR